MGRPLVTSDQPHVIMCVFSISEVSDVFADQFGIRPSWWELPGARADDSRPLVVMFARVPPDHERAGMLAFRANWTFGDWTTLIGGLIDTIEDLPLVLADDTWRSDDRAMLKWYLDDGLKQAMFADPQ